MKINPVIQKNYGTTRNSVKNYLKLRHPLSFAIAKKLLRKVRTIKGAIRTAKVSLWIKKTVNREEEKLLKIRQKPNIRVLFVVIHYSTWKTSHLYQLLTQDPIFSPCIIIAPDIVNSPAWPSPEATHAYNSFKSAHCEVYLGSINEMENQGLVNSLDPDVVFFNNPHGLTSNALHLNLVERCLACYIPYSIDVSKYNNDQDQYNQPFHNAVWRIFAPHLDSFATYKCTQNRNAKNVVVTGYPGLEDLAGSSQKATGKNEKKKIIWAPHHTIASPSLPYSNFLRYSDLFLSLTEKYKDQIEWIFKPHPLLMSRLLKHEAWGEERTKKYYSSWRNGSNTRLELDGYVELFLESDAMIHDCGSFLAEYLYVNKPVMYLWSSPNLTNYFNQFGLSALSACERGDNESDITRFIEDILEDRDVKKVQREEFSKINPVIIDGITPSERIVHELKNALKLKAL